MINVNNKGKPKENITITLPDGKTMEGVSYETTPLDIASKISTSLAKKVTAAKVKYLR